MQHFFAENRHFEFDGFSVRGIQCVQSSITREDTC